MRSKVYRFGVVVLVTMATAAGLHIKMWALDAA